MSCIIQNNGLTLLYNMKTHGGKRPGAGRKPGPHKSKNVTFRVRVEWIPDVKAAVRKTIDKLKKQNT